MGIKIKYQAGAGIVGKYASEMAKGQSKQSRIAMEMLRQQSHRRYGAAKDYQRGLQARAKDYRAQQAIEGRNQQAIEGRTWKAGQDELADIKEAIDRGEIELTPNAQNEIDKLKIGRADFWANPRNNAERRARFDDEYYRREARIYQGGTQKSTQPTPADEVNANVGHFGLGGFTLGGKDGGKPTHWRDPKTGEPKLIKHDEEDEPGVGGTGSSRKRRKSGGGGGDEVPGQKEWETRHGKLQSELSSIEEAEFAYREKLQNKKDDEGKDPFYTADKDTIGKDGKIIKGKTAKQKIDELVAARFKGRRERFKENWERLGDEPANPPQPFGPGMEAGNEVRGLNQADMDLGLGDLLTRMGIQQPKTAEEAAALAPGSTFMDPDGEIRTMPTEAAGGGAWDESQGPRPKDPTYEEITDRYDEAMDRMYPEARKAAGIFGKRRDGSPRPKPGSAPAPDGARGMTEPAGVREPSPDDGPDRVQHEMPKKRMGRFVDAIPPQQLPPAQQMEEPGHFEQELDVQGEFAPKPPPKPSGETPGYMGPVRKRPRSTAGDPKPRKPIAEWTPEERAAAKAKRQGQFARYQELRRKQKIRQAENLAKKKKKKKERQEKNRRKKRTR